MEVVCFLSGVLRRSARSFAVLGFFLKIFDWPIQKFGWNSLATNFTLQIVLDWI